MKYTGKDLVKGSIYVVPIIDIVNGALIKIYGISGFGITCRLIFLLLYLIIIVKRLSRTGASLLFAFVYVIVSTLLTNMIYDMNMFNNISSAIKYAYFLSVVYALSKTNVQKDILFLTRIKYIYCFIFPFGILIPQFLGMSFSSYAEGQGELGFVYAVNAYTYVMLVSLFWSIGFLLKKFNSTHLLMLMMNLVTITRIGTKSVYTFGVLILLYYVLKSVFMGKGTSILKGVFASVFIACIIMITCTLFKEDFLEIRNRWIYFGKKADFKNMYGVLLFLTSGRIGRINLFGACMIKYPLGLLFGLGISFPETVSSASFEMDIFNLLLFFGIIGTILYLSIFVSILKNHTNRSKDNIVLLIISFLYLFFGGHVLGEPVSSTVFAILLCIPEANNLVIKKPDTANGCNSMINIDVRCENNCIPH